MKLYLKQKVFSWRDKFHVYDEFQNEKYYVEGEIFSFGKKLHIYDCYKQEVAFIHQKVISFLPRFFINRNGEDITSVVKKFTFLHQEYDIEGLGWKVEGDFTSHEYEIKKSGVTIAKISKKWLAWGDTYEINIADGIDEVLVLSVVVVIDAVLAMQNSANS